jgi:putative transposase
LKVKVHSASIQDRDGCKLLLENFDLKTIKKIFVDGGYAGQIIEYVKEKFGVILEVVKRTDPHKFVILKKRWIVERSNSWLTTCKRLTRDFENKIRNQESMIYLRNSQILLNRLCMG